jgi:hypothetical protein
MADVNYTLKSTVRRQADVTPGPGNASSLCVLTATRSVTARTNGNTMKMVRLPSRARLHGLSRVNWDDLASTGSPTLDIGIAPVNDAANAVTADPDALNDGLDLFTAAGTALMIKDHANYGKQVWEYVAGLTQDPNMEMDIYVSFVDAATNTTGDVTLEVYFSFD